MLKTQQQKKVDMNVMNVIPKVLSWNNLKCHDMLLKSFIKSINQSYSMTNCGGKIV